jgi:hypothetical protein
MDTKKTLVAYTTNAGTKAAVAIIAIHPVF